jgi:hypothetical protein
VRRRTLAYWVALPSEGKGQRFESPRARQTSFGGIQGAHRRAAADTSKPADASDFCRAYISNTSNVARLALFFWVGRK